MHTQFAFLYDLIAWPYHSLCNWYFGNLIDVTQALALTTLKSLLPLAMVFNARNLKLGYFAGYWVVPCPNRIDCLKHHQSWITTSRVERSKQTIGQFDILAGLGHDIGQRPWKHNQPKLHTSCVVNIMWPPITCKQSLNSPLVFVVDSSKTN